MIAWWQPQTNAKTAAAVPYKGTVSVHNLEERTVTVRYDDGDEDRIQTETLQVLEHSGVTSHDVVTLIIAEHLSLYVHDAAKGLCDTSKFQSYSTADSSKQAEPGNDSKKRKRTLTVAYNPSGIEGKSDKQTIDERNKETEALHNAEKPASQVEGIAKSKSSRKCKCGSTGHQRTTHLDCPINRRQRQKKP